MNIVRFLDLSRETRREILDDPEVDPSDRDRSLRDVERSNVLFGGRRAVMLALLPAARAKGSMRRGA